MVKPGGKEVHSLGGIPLKKPQKNKRWGRGREERKEKGKHCDSKRLCWTESMGMKTKPSSIFIQDVGDLRLFHQEAAHPLFYFLFKAQPTYNFLSGGFFLKKNDFRRLDEHINDCYFFLKKHVFLKKHSLLLYCMHVT